MFKLSKTLLTIHRSITTKVGILGVPLDKGQHKPGVAEGPDAIRSGNLVEQIKNIREDINVKDYGNVTHPKPTENIKIENMKQYSDVMACNAEVSKAVEKIIKDGRICLTLGGDHSLGLGTVDGHMKAKNENICVLWVDAHSDINTNKTSPSGNIHGMPLALLAKELRQFWPKNLPQMEWQNPMLSLRNLAYIGLRSVDEYEKLFIEKFGIAAYAMDDVVKYGIHNVVEMALDRIDPQKTRSIHISFDIDAIEGSEVPSTCIPLRGGLSLREGVHLIEQILETGRLGAMDLVEVNPAIGSKDDVNKTVDAAIHLLKAACGSKRRGLLPHNNTIPT